jgi:hypothetical protein
MDLIYYGPTIEDYPTQNGMHAYGKATNEGIGDYSDLLDLIYTIDGVQYDSPNAFALAVEEVLNVDSFLRYMAVVNLLSNWDSYPNTGNNYYLFDNSLSGRFEWIPWDLTWGGDPRYSLFGRGEPGLVDRAPLYDRVFEVERYRVQYMAYLDLLVRHWFNEDHAGNLIHAYHTRIAPYVTQGSGDKMFFGDTHGFPFEVFQESWVGLVDFVRERSQYVQEIIAVDTPLGGMP